MNNQFKNKSGFTLLESLLASVIIIIAITGPFAYISNSYRNLLISIEKSSAIFLAVSEMEKINYLLRESSLDEKQKLYLQDCSIRPDSANNSNCIITDIDQINLTYSKNLQTRIKDITSINDFSFIIKDPFLINVDTKFRKTVVIESDVLSNFSFKNYNIKVIINWEDSNGILQHYALEFFAVVDNPNL